MHPRARYLYIVVFTAVSLLLTACLQTSSEPEIRTTRVLSPEPAMPTAGPLPTRDPATLDLPVQFDFSAGAALYEANCAACHGPTGAGDGPAAAGIVCEMPRLDQRSSDVTLLDWFNTISMGTRMPPDPACPMPPWAGEMSEEKIWNVTAYALTLGGDSEAELASGLETLRETVAVDSESPSESAGGASEEVVGTTDDSWWETDGIRLPRASVNTVPDTPASGGSAAAQTSTEVPDAAPPDGAAFTLSGTIVNGSEGGTVPEALPLELIIVNVDQTGAARQEFGAEISSNPDGSFVFENVPLAEGLLSVQTDYAGIRQFSDFVVVPQDIVDGRVDLNFTIYEVTDDPSDIVVLNADLWFDGVTPEGLSVTVMDLEYANRGDRAFVDEEGLGLTVTLPSDARGPEIQSFGAAQDRFVRVDSEDQIVFRDTFPLFPGEMNRVALRAFYEQVYDGSVVATQQFPYPVDNLTVYVSDLRDLQLESEQLAASATGTLGERVYNGYALTASTLERDEVLSYRISDGPNTASVNATAIAARTQPPATEETDSEDDSSGLGDSTLLILGAGLLLIIGGGMYLFYDIQKTRLLTQSAVSTSTPDLDSHSQEDLIAEIAALDDAYEQGEVDEATYTRERNALKAALRRYYE
ncbi:MAG: cytochrome c [Chloroflexi bacterium]|nr:cytochrome c [Chloroflexota bacterium]